MSDAEHQIEDAIEAADNPTVGETPEAETATSGEADSAQSQDDESDSGQDWRTWSGRAVKDE